jgi:hypothetical protein
MSLIETMWGHLDVGALIVDGNGTHWRVRERRVSPDHDIALLITDPQNRGRWAVKRHEDPVILVDESAGRAVDTVVSVLAGTVKMEPLPKGPDDAKTRALYRAHLHWHHHASLSPTADKESGTLAELIELHAIMHAAARPSGIPHTHDLEI